MTPGPERAHHTDVSSRPTLLALVLAIFSTVSISAGLVISLFTHIHAGPSPHWAVFVLLPLAMCSDRSPS